MGQMYNERAEPGDSGDTCLDTQRYVEMQSIILHDSYHHAFGVLQRPNGLKMFI